MGLEVDAGIQQSELEFVLVYRPLGKEMEPLLISRCRLEMQLFRDPVSAHTVVV